MTLLQAKPCLLKARKEWDLARFKQAGENFANWIFPVIKNTSPVDITDELVSVQPLSEPSPGMLMELVYLFENRLRRVEFRRFW